MVFNELLSLTANATEKNDAHRWKVVLSVAIYKNKVMQFGCINSHMPMLRNRKDRLSVFAIVFWAQLCFESCCVVCVCALAQSHCWKYYIHITHCTLHITHTLRFRTICSLFQATWDMEMPIQYLHKINVNEITFRKYQLSAFDTYCLLLLLGQWWMGLSTTCSVCGIFDPTCVIVQWIRFECLKLFVWCCCCWFFYQRSFRIWDRNAEVYYWFLDLFRLLTAVFKLMFWW